MRIIVLLSLSLLLAACATNTPEGFLQGQAADRLPWAKPSYFSSLSNELDFFPNELIAIFDRGNDDQQPNIILMKALEDAKRDGLIVNNIKIQPDSIGLINTYDTMAAVPPINLAPAPVCGKFISHFSYFFPVLDPNFLPNLPLRERELQQAIDTLIAVSNNYLVTQAQRKELYGISPRGKGPGTTKDKVAETLEVSTSTNQANFYNSSIAPAFTSTNWSYSAVNAVQGISAVGVRVAVLDTGVNQVGSLMLDSPANFVTLQPGTTLPTQVADDDFDLSATSYRDGHGTGVAALIADKTYGIAPGATIIPVKTCDKKGVCDDITVTRGVCYANAVGADVINMSLGTLSNAPMLRQAIREVVARGTTVIASAGNTNFFSSTRKNRAAFPAAWATGTTGFMSIGAVDAKLAYADFATASSTVEMVAPGADTQLGTTLPDKTGIETYAADGTPMVFMEGTSFSAPFVVGAAANLYAQCPNLSNNSYLNSKWVELNLMSTVTRWTPSSQIRRTLPWPLKNGFVPGLLNVGNSLTTPCP